MRSRRLTLVFTVLALAATGVGADPGFLISGVTVVDGTGAGRLSASVRVRDGLILQVGELQRREGEVVIEGHGKVLAPGFIDSHSHADLDIQEQREALAAVSQGITTAVVGQDGTSPYPLSDWVAAMEARPGAINFASYAGHNSLRDAVLGKGARRKASDGEIEAMGSLLQRELDAGALGFGTGLEYEPGIWSDPAEVMTLARLAAGAGGRYISHVRSEDRWFWDAIEEIIGIGRHTGMPVKISHIKLAQRDSLGRAAELVSRLNAARAEGIDITADIYPYTYWQSNIMVLVPSRDLSARHEFEYALREVSPPEGMWLTRFDPQPEYIGKRLPEIASSMGTDPVTALMRLAAASEAHEAVSGEGADGIIGTSMTDEDVEALVAWPHSNICTDGALDGLHPRGFGAFPRVLGRYVREQGLLTLETAIHKMTGLTASHLGIADRGTIEPGKAADLVLFDPDTVIDNATPADPQAQSGGILAVWVNGVKVFDEGAATGLYPGRVLRRATP